MTAPSRLPTLRLPERVYADIATYRAEVARFQRGETNDVAFRAFRVPMGVYEHRQTGHYMVRVRLGAGLASPEQLECIAALAAQHGDGILHVTTRQDIQIHDVSLEGTVAVQEGLLAANLSARGGGGNTVRNVTACPRSLVCPKAVFDVAPHALATAEYLLQLQRSYGLPRKFKIAFSGCADDCAFAAVNDLGFFAHEHDGRPGFAVYAGGGLGPQASAGVRIEELIPVDQVFLVAEGVERLFDRLGDRANKNRARLRYVLRRLGPEAFVAEYRKERDALAAEGVSATSPVVRAESTVGSVQGGTVAVPGKTAAPDLLPERNPASVTLRLCLPNGRISSADLVKVAAVARDLGIGLVAATQQQDLLLLGIAVDQVAEARAALNGIAVEARARLPKIVACAGASTCKLGICLSPALANAIDGRLRAAPTATAPGLDSIRISGCPNACGNHPIAALGLEGCARRHDGRLLPLYELLAGGQSKEGQARFAERIGTVPARVLPELMAEVHARGLSSPDEIRPVVERYSHLPHPLPEDFYIDHGSTEPFSLAGRGPGECGAGVLDIMRVDLDEARDALAAADGGPANERSAAIHRAIASSACALLPLFGIEARKDREVFQAATANLITPGWVSADAEALLAAALDWRLGDRPSLDELLPQARRFHERIRQLFASLDGNLRFQLQPIKQAPPEPSLKPIHDNSTTNSPATKLVDLRGVKCPMNFVKAKVALEKLGLGDTLDVLLDDGEPRRNVPASFADQGQEVLELTPDAAHFRLRVRRAK